jgi:hypothetical protein
VWESANRQLRAAGVVDGKSKVLLATEVEAMAALLRVADTKRWGRFVATPEGDLVRTR